MRVRSVLALVLLSSLTGGSVACGASPEGSGDSNVPSSGVNDPPNAEPSRPVPMPAYLKKPASSTFMTGVEMGTPFDSIVDAPAIGGASALASGFALEDVPGLLTAKATIRRIETTEDLYSALEVTASLSVQGAVWGASASTSFARERQLHSEYLYVFVDASASGRTQRVANAQLTEEAKKLSPEEFYKRFGDRYASTIVMGQQVFGLIEIRTRSLEDKERLAVSLGISYGASSFDASFKSTMEQKTTSLEKHVWAGALGTTMPIKDDIGAFIDAVDAKFNEFTSTKSDPGTQTLSFRYSSYYGMGGYPGVPVDAEAKVAEHAQAASDFLLYRSLLNDYTTRGYDVAKPTLSGIKSYASDLEVYLTSSLNTSPALPPRPVVAENSKLESFAMIDATTSPGKGFVVHGYKNGFVPKKLADYEIPLRYTREGVRGGVAFSPITVNEPVVAYASLAPSSLHLWAVQRDTPTGEKTCLAYRWADGPSYFLGDVVTNGQLDPVAIQAELGRDEITNVNDASKQTGKRFVLVNEASGLVIMQRPGTNDLSQGSLATASTSVQWWNTTTDAHAYIADMFARIVNDRKQPNQRWFSNAGYPWNVAYNSSAPSMAIHSWSFAFGNAQLFVIEDAGNGFRTIKTQTGGGVVSVSPVCTNGPCDKPWLTDGQPIVQLPIDPATNRPGAHQRWRIVPEERVEEIR
jgi:hypothetical protein